MPSSETDFFRVVKQLDDPFKLQEYILSLTYNPGKRLSLIDVIRLRKGDCLEAAVFAVFVLDYHGYDAFLLDLEAVRDEDHILAVYKKNGRYGSIAQSKFLGLRDRMPVYCSLRELVMSYFNSYFNFFGEFTLRRFSEPFRLDSFFSKHTLGDVRLVKDIEKKISNIPHKDIAVSMALPRVSRRKFWSEIAFLPKNVRVGKRYKKE